MEKEIATENKPFLTLRHLVKVYPNGEKAVYDFDLDIAKNEFIVFVGPSGCGKSTTLRMIAGLEDITEGDIYLGDELLNYKPSSERKMAIVFQSYALYPQMTVYDNIAFPLTINKYPMPKVNAVLRAEKEIAHILEGVAYNKFVGVLYNSARAKGKAAEKAEEAATVFGISFDAARILMKAFTPYMRDDLETLNSKEIELRAAIAETLKPLVEAARSQSVGVKYDSDFNELDAEGNIVIEMRKYTPYEIKTRVYETAEKLDLTPYLDKLPKELSGGQMQRVALGRAIIKNVPIFMMDEPLSNLDAKLRLTMRSEIVKLHNSIGATTIYVTHDQTEAMTMASRIVVMSRGFVQQIGTPEEVYNDPKNIFVARFIGSPTMNVFEADFDRKSKTLTNGTLKIPVTDEFIARHDAFYSDKLAEYTVMSNNFDEKAKEKIRKTLSATGEYADKSKKKKEAGGLAKKIKDFFSVIRKQQPTEPVDTLKFERDVCTEKLEKLTAFSHENHSLQIGIRPERIKLEKVKTGKKYTGCVLVKPTVVELLGGEYNVHFTFCGKNMVGQIDAVEKVTTADDIAVKFSFDDIYIFDPVTGDVI